MVRMHAQASKTTAAVMRSRGVAGCHNIWACSLCPVRARRSKQRLQLPIDLAEANSGVLNVTASPASSLHHSRSSTQAAARQGRCRRPSQAAAIGSAGQHCSCAPCRDVCSCAADALRGGHQGGAAPWGGVLQAAGPTETAVQVGCRIRCAAPQQVNPTHIFSALRAASCCLLLHAAAHLTC